MKAPKAAKGQKALPPPPTASTTEGSRRSRRASAPSSWRSAALRPRSSGFPILKDPKDQLDYLGTRNIAIFSHDLDSFDFKMRKPEDVIKSVMTKLERKGKGIILMHDFQQATAKAMPELLNQLKAKGYKVVHMKAKTPLATHRPMGRGGQGRDQGRDRRRPSDVERDPHRRRAAAIVGDRRDPDSAGQEIGSSIRPPQLPAPICRPDAAW